MSRTSKKIRIKRFDKELPLPAYKSKGAAAFDLCARVETKIPARSIGYVPLNIAVETPKGHFLMMAARSSTHKKGLMLANGIGIFDPDFSGDGDEFTAALYNFSNKPVLIEKGERITQGMVIKIIGANWKETDTMNKKTRGGFGSTGKK
jgi:dUTP pyrophosphatase